MAISGDSAPQFTTIAKFIRELGDEAAAIFAQVLLICDRQGLIGRQMFAIDGVKLPSNADKRRRRHPRRTHARGRAHGGGSGQDAQGAPRRDESKDAAKAAADAERIGNLQTEAEGFARFLPQTRTPL